MVTEPDQLDQHQEVASTQLEAETATNNCKNNMKNDIAAIILPALTNTSHAKGPGSAVPSWSLQPPS